MYYLPSSGFTCTPVEFQVGHFTFPLAHKLLPIPVVRTFHRLCTAPSRAQELPTPRLRYSVVPYDGCSNRMGLGRYLIGDLINAGDPT